MTLQRKISAIVAMMTVIYGGIAYGVLAFQLMPAFRTLEANAISTDYSRTINALAHDIERVSMISGDWAPWDDTYRFVQGKNDQYVDANLDADTFAVLGLDVALFLDSSHRVAWGILAGETLNTSEIPPELELSSGNVARLLKHTSARSINNGIINTSQGLMIVSARPIVTNDFLGPIAGTVLFGYFLTDERLSELRSRTEVELDLLPLHDDVGELTELATTLKASSSGRLSDMNQDFRFEYSVLEDIEGSPLAIIRVTMPRAIESLGQSTVQAVLISLSLVLFLIAATIWLSLQRYVVRPLATLTGHMARIQASGDLSERISSTSKDEMGKLARTFDELASELQTTRHELLAQSFKAGMAETAAEVLHNIRNALTPLVNRISSSSKALLHSRDAHLERAIKELSKPNIDSERRQKLQEYVTLAFEDFDETCGAIIADLKVAATQGDQIESILSDQELISHTEPVIEAVELHKVVMEASGVVPSGESVATIVVDDNLRNLKVRVHRIGLLQILSNLVLNAHESIQREDSSVGKIHISATCASDEENLVSVSVSDNGIGMDGDLKKKIFKRGFTVKTHGRGGLGLHWCANTIASMGGKIRAESEGPGLGALFTLDIPIGKLGSDSS